LEDSFTSEPTKLEGWYQHNVWSRLIGPAFHNMKVELLRGMSFASRTVSRKQIGRKGDGIFRIAKQIFGKWLK